MHLIRIHTTTYSIPSQWDELSHRQLKRIAWLSTLQKDGTALSKLFFYILTLHLPIWKRLRLQWFYLFQATTEERGDFLLLVQSFRDQRRLTAQKLEKLRVRTVLLYGPASGLANCTFFEYIQAEKYFLNYSEASSLRGTKQSPEILSFDQEKWLNQFIATLYRPSRLDFNPALDEDRRIPLTDAGIRFRLPIVSAIDRETKLAILMWFDGCRQQLIQAFPTIFPKKAPEPEEGSMAKLKPSKAKSGSWIDMISELAGSPAEYDRIGNTNLFTALTDIAFRIRKAKEAEQARADAARKRKR